MYIFSNSLWILSTTSQNIPSVSFKIFLFVIAKIFLKPSSFAIWNPFLTTLSQPFLVILRIAIAESSVILNSIPAYKPSVASRIQMKFNCFSVFLYVLIGLTLAYNPNFCLMLTATLRGAFGFGIVVVGPLKQASLSSSNFQTSLEIYESPPIFCHHSDPASHWIKSTLVSHAFITLIIASTSSGPVPSPLMIAAVLLCTN